MGIRGQPPDLRQSVSCEVDRSSNNLHLWLQDHLLRVPLEYLASGHALCSCDIGMPDPVSRR